MARISAKLHLMRTQRRSSRCSRNDFTAPPSTSRSSGRISSSPSAMIQDERKRSGLGDGNGGSGRFRGRQLRTGRRSRRRRFLIHGIMKFIGNVVGGLLEFLHGLAQPFGEFGYLLGAKQDQRGAHYHHDFRATHSQ